MKVAILLNTTWNVYNFRRGLVEHLVKSGDEVVAITPADDFVGQLEQIGVKHFDVRLASSGVNPAQDLRYYQSLKKILGQVRPDVILSFTIKPNIFGSLAAHRLRIPIICNVSGLGTVFLWKGWVKWVAKRLYRQAFYRADFIFFQNVDDRNEFLSEIPIDDSKTDILPGSGINLSEYNGTPPTFDQPLKFLMISRLLIDKGVNEYLEAASRLRAMNFQFYLLGKYDPTHKRSISLQTFDKIENSNVKYLGESDDIAKIIGETDVVVLPSYREGTPRTLLEGAAMSRPLLATDVPGCREVVLDGHNGLLVSPKSPDDLADKMEQLAALTTEELLQLAINSRKHVEDHFDERIVVEKYMTVIARLKG